MASPSKLTRGDKDVVVQLMPFCRIGCATVGSGAGTSTQKKVRTVGMVFPLLLISFGITNLTTQTSYVFD